MAKRLFSRLTINSNNLPLRSTIKRVENVRISAVHTEATEIPVKEIQIPVKWGHVSAKLWGHENEEPILALHGWQDNAGTWDPLASILAKKRPILAIDFPGHGLSSWIPPGMQYYPWDLPRLILYIKDYFKWNKVSLLSHSMGSIASLRFASIFPEYIDFYIAVDSLVADDYDLNQVVGNMPKILRKIQVIHSRMEEEPPSYTLEELAKKWHLGTTKSVSLESVHHLITRGVKESKLNPGKYYFSRDSRLKTILFNPESKKFVEALVRRLKCPTLYIKAIDSPYASDQFSVEMREIIEKNNEQFECHFVPGTHHVHLNDGDKIAPLIINFLQKYKFIN
ncbi:serine hydrolase-like protein [Epargyreus clarus]|uniref:serine hydrolase-like protein n=1 Tax=Epargyreus clarus TaxID=520877 RepID=UPI003C2CFF0A